MTCPYSVGCLLFVRISVNCSSNFVLRLLNCFQQLFHSKSGKQFYLLLFKNEYKSHTRNDNVNLPLSKNTEQMARNLAHEVTYTQFAVKLEQNRAVV